jgi:hypothetical protein
MFDTEFEDIYNEALKRYNANGNTEILTLHRLTIKLLNSKNVEKAIQTLKLDNSKIIKIISVNENSDFEIDEAPSESNPFLTNIVERVILRAIIITQEKEVRKLVSSCDILLAVLSEYNSSISRELNLLGLYSSKLHDFINRKDSSNQYDNNLIDYSERNKAKGLELYKIIISVFIFVVVITAYVIISRFYKFIG